MKYRDQTATYLRNAIIEHIDLDPADASGLLTSPYDLPYSWTFVPYMWGTLFSDGELPNKAGIEYPVVNWALIPHEGEHDADGDAAIEFDIMVDDSFLSDEVQFECTGVLILQSKLDV